MTEKYLANFKIKGNTVGVNQPILLLFYIHGIQYRYYTGVKCLPEHWDSKKKRIKNLTSVRDSHVLNLQLSHLEAEFNKIVHNELMYEREPTKDIIFDGLDKFLGKKNKIIGFWDFVAQFIIDSKDRVNPETGVSISPETIRKYKYCKDVLKEFEQSDKQISFDGLDLQWFERFQTWCSVEKNYAVNSIDKIVECLKTWMNAAIAKHLTENEAFKKFKIRTEASETIYLNESELEAIRTVELSGTALDNARDLFLLGAYTGLRFSDTTTLKKNNLDLKNNEIIVFQKKTGGQVKLPILPHLRKIIDKRKGELPYPISNQKLNSYIKEVAKLAGIAGKVECQTTKGGKRIKHFVEKWEMVSSHTARRSFASILLPKRSSTANHYESHRS